uniref:SFRICE_023959 n=1 Tax=Spodoptera frugiperda TaxID=7108 RepID=A0A2H1VNB0_SPOFR
MRSRTMKSSACRTYACSNRHNSSGLGNCVSDRGCISINHLGYIRTAVKSSTLGPSKAHWCGNNDALYELKKVDGYSYCMYDLVCSYWNLTGSSGIQNSSSTTIQMKMKEPYPDNPEDDEGYVCELEPDPDNPDDDDGYLCELEPYPDNPDDDEGYPCELEPNPDNPDDDEGYPCELEPYPDNPDDDEGYECDLDPYPDSPDDDDG